MKSLYTVFVFLVAVIQMAYAFCGDKCDASIKPSKVSQGNLELVAVVDSANIAIQYQCTGTVQIVDDCHFKVTNFTLYPQTVNARWYGAATKESTDGINLSGDDYVSAVAPNLPQDIEVDVSTIKFCTASLVKEIGVIRLMDQNDQLIAQAVVNNDVTPSTNNGNSTTNGGNNSEKNGASTLSMRWSTLAMSAIAFLAMLLF